MCTVEGWPGLARALEGWLGLPTWEELAQVDVRRQGGRHP